MGRGYKGRRAIKYTAIFVLFSFFMLFLAQPAMASASLAQDLDKYFDQDSWDPGYEGDNETAGYTGDTDYIPDPDSALKRIDEEVDEMEGGDGGWWEWLIPGWNVYKGVSKVLGAVGKGLKKIIGYVWNSVFFFVLVNMITGLHWILELLVPEINSRIELLGRASVLNSGAHVDGNDPETVLDNWPGSNFNYDPNYTDYSDIPTDLPAVVPSGGGEYEVKDCGYITGKFKTVRAIALWLVVILMIVAALKAIAGSITGYGLYTAKSIIPRCVFAVVGSYFALWICQLILDINWAMSFDVVGSTTILTRPLRSLYMKLVEQASMGSSFVLCVAVIILIVMLAILFIIYHLRMAIILVLAVLSPIAITCYILDDTQYITFTWLKAYIGIVFLQFLHVVILAVFESTIFAGMDVFSNCLICLSMVYIMLKLPGWLLKTASAGGASGAGMAAAFMAGRGAKEVAAAATA